MFGQLYEIDPSKAIEYRDKHLKEAPYNVVVRENVLKLIDEIIRECHPFAQVYKSSAEIYNKEVQKRQNEGNLDVPNFRVIRIFIIF